MESGDDPLYLWLILVDPLPDRIDRDTPTPMTSRCLPRWH